MLQFPVVRRGFDRQQVQAWDRELTGQIEQERLRADQAERTLYRMQLQQPATPSFTHLGSHAADIIEDAGQSAEKLLLDAAERAQEATDAVEAEAAEIITAAEGRAGEIEGAARQNAEQLRAEGARVAQEARQAAAAMRSQAEYDAQSLLEEAREGTDTGSGRKRSGSGWRSRARPGGWRACGSGATSSLGGCTATWSRCWRRSAAALAAPKTSSRRLRPSRLSPCPPGRRDLAGGRAGHWRAAGQAGQGRGDPAHRGRSLASRACRIAGAGRRGAG